MAQLYDALQEALKHLFINEQGKAERLLKLYNSGKLSMQDNDGGDISVGSERKNGTSYTVSLIDYSCGCQQAQKLSYAGLFCKKQRPPSA